MSRLCSLGLALLLPLLARAHDPGLSSAFVRLGAREIEVELAIPWADSGNEPGAQGILLRIDGKLATPSSVETRRFLGDRIELWLRYAAPERAPERIELESRMLAELPFGHKQFVRVLAADGSPLASAVLSAYASSVSVSLP